METIKSAFLRNKIDSFKQIKGSIAVIVLIIGIVVILSVSTMAAFMIKDVKFTQLDEQKLQALNIAEAGISNMYLNIGKYYKEGVPLPSSPYTGNLKDGTEILGSYTIDYEEYYNNGKFSGYIITSKGIDKSGTERKIKVRLAASISSSSSIFDYIYTGQSAVFSPNGNAIDGPFYTEGDLTIEGSAAMLQAYNSGPVIIKGNLTMNGDTTTLTSDSLFVGGNVLLEGSAKIKGGQVSIAGNLTMNGGTSIGDPLAGPMIVMGDIDMSSGSPQIGMPGESLVLSCHGTVTNPAWAPIYAVRDDSLTYTFFDPRYNVSDLVDQYRSGVSSSLIINRDISLDEGTTGLPGSSGGNSLSIVQENGKWVIEVHGNVIINGSLTIGGTSWYPLSTNIIYYRGSGTIYTTEDVTTHAKLIPLNNFPTDDFLVFVSESNINFDIFNFWDPPDCASPNIYTVAVAKGNISVSHGTVRGTLIAGGNLNIDKDFAKVCYEESISEYLPSDLSGSASGSGTTTFTQEEWQEIAP